MKIQDTLPWAALASLPAVVSGYLLSLCDADCALVRAADAGSGEGANLVAHIRSFKQCADLLQSHADRARLGAALGELFDRNPWLKSFRCELSTEWQIGDEGQTYESTSCLVHDVESTPEEGFDAQVQGSDGSFDAEAALAIVDEFFEEHDHDLAQLLREGSESALWTLHLRRDAIAGELGADKPSGRALWDLLFPDSPGLVPSGNANGEGVATSASPVQRHPLAAFAGQMQAMLNEDGYSVHRGTVDDGAELEGRWWFSWSATGMSEPEVGDTLDSELAAWLDALKHRLANSAIPLHRLV
jgi:hypothetical protein